MSVNYKPLWKLLIDKDLNKRKLAMLANISVGTISKMGNSEYVALEVLEKISKALDCRIEEIVEFVNDEKEKE